MSETTPETQHGPLGSIALSLSGGGVRAVGFHLGTISYLHRLGLLEDVTILSTVSGGSFVGLSYALSQVDHASTPPLKMDFCDYFRSLAGDQHSMEKMAKSPNDGSVRPFLYQNTVDNVLNILGRPTPPSPVGRRNFVTAYAQMYDDAYFRGRTFDVLWSRESHLRHIIVNATEFKTGLAFRFAKAPRETRSGSQRVWVEEHHIRHARLADIMAASSDIPGGLEPIFFPDDFHWQDADGQPAQLAAVRRYMHGNVDTKSVALMDGGIYDNQGAMSILLALLSDKRAEAEALEGQTPEFEGAYAGPSGGPSSGYGNFSPGPGGARSGNPYESSPFGLLALFQGRRWSQAYERPNVPLADGAHDVAGAGSASAPTPEDRVITCPRCGTAMAMEMYTGTQVEVDRCSQCNGVWFDGGEMETIFGEEPDIGTLIVSDTPLRTDPVYESREPVKAGRLTLGGLHWAMGMVGGMAVLSAIALTYEYLTNTIFDEWPGLWNIRDWDPGIHLTPATCAGQATCNWSYIITDLASFVFPLALVFLVIWSLWVARKHFRRLTKGIPGAWRVFKNMSFSQFVDLITLRAGSLFALTNEVFMNRIRHLGYALLNSQGTLRRKLVVNEIDSVRRDTDVSRMPGWLRGSSQMTGVVVPKASDMGTRMWFEPPVADQRGELDMLLACGQFTICRNLLKHLLQRHGQPAKTAQDGFQPGELMLPVDVDPAIQELFDLMRRDWQAFRQDAYWFTDRLRADMDSEFCPTCGPASAEDAAPEQFRTASPSQELKVAT